MFALYSDDMVRRQFVVDIAFGVTEDALFEFLAATPVPLPPDQSVPILPFDDVRVCVTVVWRSWDPVSRAEETSASSSRRAAAGYSTTGSI